MLDYFILFIAWVIYFFLHSVLASSHIKEQAIGKLSPNQRKYRLFYALVSTLGLVAILALQMYLPSKRVIPESSILQVSGLILGAFGVIILKQSFRYISMRSFIGLESEPEMEMIRKGLHRKVRHPIYLGTILLIFGAVCFVPSDLMIVSALSIFVYLPLGIMFEEEKLVKLYGQEYLAYRKTTPAIIPDLKSFF